MPRKKLFRIGRSRTGLGLFAVDYIKKGQLIVEYSGPRVANKLAEKLEDRGNKYLYEINSRWTINGTTRRNIGRYANHSCRPNAESDTIRGPRARGRKGGMVVIRAIKAIKPGDEITYDYGRDYLRNVITLARCKCDKCTEKRAAERRARRLRKRRADKRRKSRRAKR
jgi:SET domain-containing protein